MRRTLLVLAVVAGCKSSESKLSGAGSASPTAGSAASVVTADAAAPASLQSELEAMRTKLQLPALAVAAWRDGTLLDQAVVGVRKLDDPASKATLADEWHLGSNTKAMTATLIAIFVDRGTLRWTDTIGQLLGKDAKVDPGFKDVTLDQLIRHEGGFAAEPPAPLWKQLWTDGAAPDARTKYVRAILAAPPSHKPGTFLYSNTNYIVAGALLEAKTGKRWEELIKSELFDKLAMTSCGFGAPGVKGTVDQPRGHDGGDTPIEPGPAGDNPPGLGPAGTVHCSLADYGKFLNMLATGTPALVSPEQQQVLQTARSDGPMGYAGGWMVATKGKATMLVHSGSNTMWYATAVVIPAKHFALAIVANKANQKIEESLADLLTRFVQ